MYYTHQTEFHAKCKWLWAIRDNTTIHVVFLCASISTNFKSTSSSSACDASKWILIALNIHNKNNNNISKNSLIYSGKKNDDKLCTKKWLNWDIARDERETSDRHQICIWLVQSRWIWACRILNEFNGGFDR